MLKTRIIPCLFLKNGWLVRSEKFLTHQVFGNPIHEVSRYNAWKADELVYIDISRENHFIVRHDVKHPVSCDILSILGEVGRECRMPLTFGGGIRTLEDIENRIEKGADKITINTMALGNPNFITEAAMHFGSQCIVVSIDARWMNGQHRVFSNYGTHASLRLASEWAHEAEDRGAGEIFLNSIDRDGTGLGYDSRLVENVIRSVHIPVIVCGGAGNFEHLYEGVKLGASAVAAANIFNFTEQSFIQAKCYLKEKGVEVNL